ncbi:transmembrane channel-like protein 2-B [Brachyhypopomus gauderio]|uniref:transmembrane channel-like protein 2-B n=1 Tax=Brachyhypopomus gauderio TaxID=698409 RepID=UPI004042EB2E
MPRLKNDIAINMINAGMDIDAEFNSESDEDYNKRAKTRKKAKPATRQHTQRWAADSEEEEEDEGLHERRSAKKKKESGRDGEDRRRGGRAETAREKNASEKSGEPRGSTMRGRRRSRKEEEYENKKEKKGSYKGRKEKGEDKRGKGTPCSSLSSSDSDSESLSEGELAELLEEVEEKKKLIGTLRSKPWHMKKRLRSFKQAQEFIEAFETVMGNVKGTSIYTFKAMMNKKLNKLQQEFENLKKMFTPWQGKIKKIESHFGSTVASYFIFLRWLFLTNLIPLGLVVGLIIIPEALWGAPHGSIPRKTIPRNEQASAMDFDVLYEYGGYLKYSPFFYGYYDNKEKIGYFGYPLPMAYLLLGLILFIYILVVVIRVMAKNASESDNIGDEDVFKFSWKVFTSWEYVIGNTETAEEKSAAITFGFKESLVDDLRHFKNENPYKRWFLRFVANVLILSCLTGSGYLIYTVAKRQQKFSKMDRSQVSWLQKNEVEVVIALLGMFIPPLFEGISELEDYHPRVALWWQLSRLFALFVGNIYTFVFTVIGDVTDQLQTEMMIKNGSNFALQQYYENYTLYYNVTENIPPPHTDPADVIRGPCWETQVGIGFLKLIVSDLQVAYLSILVSDIIRGLLVRYLNYCWCWDLEAIYPSYGEFDISSNVLAIIFNQGMVL